MKISAVLVCLEGEEVHDVLNILDAVDMSIHVYVAVLCVVRLDKVLVMERTYTSLRFDGARLFGNEELLEDFAFHLFELGWLACLVVNHCPDAASIAIDGSVGSYDGEITVSEQTVDTFNPRTHAAFVIDSWHIVHLDGES